MDARTRPGGQQMIVPWRPEDCESPREGSRKAATRPRGGCRSLILKFPIGNVWFSLLQQFSRPFKQCRFAWYFCNARPILLMCSLLFAYREDQDSNLWKTDASYIKGRSTAIVDASCFTQFFFVHALEKFHFDRCILVYFEHRQTHAIQRWRVLRTPIFWR